MQNRKRKQNPKIYSNTTLVKVKYKIKDALNRGANSNTTLVKVK